MRLILMALVFVLTPLSANAYEAPFGLRWGMSIEEVKALVGKFESQEKNSAYPGLTAVEFKKAPQTPGRTGAMGAVFSPERGLIKIEWNSEIIAEDVYGHEGKEFFGQLKSILKEKYNTGKIQEMEKVGLEVFRESDEFYQCLKYTGCGLWALLIRPNSGGGIVLSLNGRGRGVGYVKITYEAAFYSAETDAAEHKRTSKDKKAF